MIALGLTTAELNRLLARVEFRIARELAAVLARIKLAMPLSTIERALLERNLDAAIDAIGLEPFRNVVAQVRQDLVPIREAGWTKEAVDLRAILKSRGVPIATLDISLGAHQVEHPDALRALERQDLTRIKEITKETEAAIRASVERSIREGVHPRDAARSLRNVIGLNQNQARAYEKFRANLLTENRDPAQVERMAAKFGQRMATMRAKTISIQETQTALNEGKRVQRERLVREGTISDQDFETEVIVADDDRTCPICRPLDGLRVPIGQPIPTSVGSFVAPPFHILCRCGTRTQLKGFRVGSSTRRQVRLLQV